MTTTTAPAARPFLLTLEIHCTPDPAFTREFGSKVKAAGSSYTECRAALSRRYVSELTTAQRTLVNQIIARFGGDGGATRALPS